jgi:hypothetical protein
VSSVLQADSDHPTWGTSWREPSAAKPPGDLADAGRFISVHVKGPGLGRQQVGVGSVARGKRNRKASTDRRLMMFRKIAQTLVVLAIAGTFVVGTTGCDEYGFSWDGGRHSSFNHADRQGFDYDNLLYNDDASTWSSPSTRCTSGSCSSCGSCGSSSGLFDWFWYWW